MEQVNAYSSILFIATTLLTLALLYKATNYSKAVIIGLLIWLALQAVISLNGFYLVTTGTPPRFALLLMPPVLFILILFLIKPARAIIDTFDVKILTLLHIIRIPVEVVLLLLYLYKLVPQVMTFEGRNFDILCGLTAPLVYYFGYVKKVLNKRVLLAWNIVCLLLLANIIVTAVLSTPFPFQKLGLEQPNIALFYFPYIWLSCCVVPIVLFAHLVSIRQLIKK